MSVSEEEQNEKTQQAKLALRRIFVMLFTLICSFIFMELEIKGFANFGGWGVIFGFVVGILALLGEDWTKTAVIACLKQAKKDTKKLAIILLLCLFVGFVGDVAIKLFY